MTRIPPEEIPTSMKKRRVHKWIHVGFLGGIVLIGLLLGGWLGLRWRADRQTRTHIEALASRIERFIAAHQRLPNPENHEEMLALGFELRVGWVPELVALNDQTYQLRLPSGFDNPTLVYDSRSKTWREEW